MRYAIAIAAASLLLPLWYVISGGDLHILSTARISGIPVATLFVLAEMALLVGLCWLAMKQVAAEGAEPETYRKNERTEPEA